MMNSDVDILAQLRSGLAGVNEELAGLEARRTELLKQRGSLLKQVQELRDSLNSLLGVVPVQYPDGTGVENPVSLIGAIESHVNADPEKRWTVSKMMATLTAEGFDLKAKKPIYSVGQTLQKMAAKGRLRLVVRGTGSAPNVYKANVPEVAPQQVQTATSDWRLHL